MSNITSLKYTSIEETGIQVTMDDGSSYSASWPCQTWHREEIEDAIKSGIEIQPFKTAEEALLDKQEEIWSAIKALREYRTLNGGVKVADKWFYTDLKSTAQYNTITNAGIQNPTLSIPDWKTMDGSFVEMTLDLVNQIQLAGITSQAQTYAVAEAHKAAMLASTDPSSYDYSTGWPVIFGE